ncbi:GntR family transcriptional regulator [Loigolactobacillus rennini]|uniref:GntR family transcriptional regulator n=2 Tax=Loigolactobacillus rennini TaxID=238013 RepID=A0A0R2DIW4_9LACO|nr:GntR family transcriptional regulator [Loigolactobacillus rennini]KRM99948.1 GntR family transcriptional regulator [Loigolactobacillus rennini DSM 20253]SFZ87217.1 Transcriptional regulator, GntR family [Loigolactobacillus rennini]
MEFDDKVPIYYQIKQYIYKEIIVNRLKPGAKLPAVRQLAVKLTVNVNTVQRALSELVNEGILKPQRGKGNFVTTDISVLVDLRRRVVEGQLAMVYDRLAELQITPDEMIQYLTNYIDQRKEQSHD